MKNNQLLPFERNRYYVGKLLTSADFQVEQSYGVQKHRFINELMFGSGIISGLGVYSLDDSSIMVESGAAIDGWGREIVVENSVMSKLSAIDGFESLTGNRAVLCLRYNEDEVSTVYAVSSGSQGEGYEYNRIREGFSLCLRDRSALPAEELSFANFLTSATLYEDGDYSVEITAPVVIACGSCVRVAVTVNQLSQDAAPISLRAEIQVPALTTASGTHSFTVSSDELLPGEGKSVTFDYWLTANPSPAPDSTLMAGIEEIRVKIGDAVRSASAPFLLKISVVNLSAREIIARATGAVSLEELSLESRNELVELAEFGLQRTKSAYIIESVVEDGVKHYIRTGAASEIRYEFEKWFSPASSASSAKSAPVSPETSQAAPAYREPLYATGMCEISIPTNAKPGQIVYSNEIVHGLGKGLVCVNAGLEYFCEDKKLKNPARNTIYGDPALFASEAPPVPASSVAVRVMNDRGSFIIAVRLDEPTPLVVLNIRWNAFLMPSSDDAKLQKVEGKSISSVRPTIVLGTRESYYFSVNFKNMEPCTLIYELTDEDSGTITPDGIYTAPGREGIFEIRISCADMPLISTYAYAVVKKHSVSETDEQK